MVHVTAPTGHSGWGWSSNKCAPNSNVVNRISRVRHGELLDGEDDVQGRQRGTVWAVQAEQDMEI